MQRTVFFIIGFLIFIPQTLAVKYVLKDGRILEGSHALLSRVDEKADTPEDTVRLIAAIDDGLRLTYLSKARIADIREEQSIPPEKFKTGIMQNFDGARYRIIGTFQNNVPFDRYGRRLLEIRHIGGIEYAEQGITELTPYYLKITGLRGDNKQRIWDMRIATDSVPREQITPILLNLVNPKNIEDRMKLVRFYYGGNRFSDAQDELQSILNDWKNDEGIQDRVKTVSFQIRQQKYQTVIDELEHRWNAGQYQFVKKYLADLEQDADLPDRLLEPVKRMLQRYDTFDRKHQTIIAGLKTLEGQLAKSDKDPLIPEIIGEIDEGLNGYTLKRLAAYELYADDAQLSASEKLAFAITGWYAGADADNSRLAVAVMLRKTQDLVRQYLFSGSDELGRKAILAKLKKMETARPDLIAGVLRELNTSPESAVPEGIDADGHGQYALPNPLIDQFAVREHLPDEITYEIQLPPEYNPNIRYPMIVSLHGLKQTPVMQIDFWRTQASRNGYIILAPHWNPKEHQTPYYDYSAFSHTAVLGGVKDAFRRFSVDTDKVFITGHGTGGTAAWDIALGHPDLWAGAMPFNAVAGQNIEVYRAAAQYVPLYLVFGELDGIGANRKWDLNASILNRYLQKQASPPDVTLIRYTGRGEDGFSEEVLHLFDWMQRRQRTVTPMEFEVDTVRAWDSFFWGVEMSQLKELPDNVYEPFEFPAKPVTAWNKRVRISCKLQKAANSVYIDIKPKVPRVQVYLTPEMIDFKSKGKVELNGKRISPANGIIEPVISVMLEDVRTRCDRLHPFWAVLE
ncbi:MAG: hypothetical protein LBT89_07640 [Planctomycetaceae bacterium]|jgi:pimeloyl-ACP methyl ester carboxylesterase|nr:hypothetical protein [Planctomycetaceae bacterium]